MEDTILPGFHIYHEGANEMTLYELSKDYLYLLGLAQDPEVDPAVLTDTMDGIYGGVQDKIDSYMMVIREVEADAEKYDEEIKRLTAQKKVLQNNAKRMKDHVMETMIAMGMKKIKTDHYNVSVAANGGVQPMEVADIEKIPEEYRVYKPEADKEKIRKALEQGYILDFAYLREKGQHLNVR